VLPSIVNSTGEFETNDLSQFNRHIEKHKYLSIKFFFNKEYLTMDLVLNTNLFKDSSVIFNKSKHMCHFKGKIKHDSTSFVAVSLCNKMVILNIIF
jgi:hypothetical protein